MTEALRPSQRYADGVARGDWLHDPAQRSVRVFSVRIDLEYAYYSIIGSQGAEPRWYGTVVYLRP